MTKTERLVLTVLEAGGDDDAIAAQLSGFPARELGPALFAAIDWHRPALLDWLLAQGVPASTRSRRRDNCTPLYYACSRGRTDLARLLLDHGAPADEPVALPHVIDTPLRCAVRRHDLLMVELLLSVGAEPNLMPDPDDDLPILCLAMETVRGEPVDDPALVQLLVDYGADVDAHDQEMQSALAVAARYDLIEAVRILLAAGASAAREDRFGYTPLHFANRREIVEALLDADARIDAQTHYGETPLMLAVLGLNEAKAQSLLFAGADYQAPCLVDDFGGFGGVTTLDLARFVANEEDCPGLLELLAAEEARRLLARLALKRSLAGEEEV